MACAAATRRLVRQKEPHESRREAVGSVGDTEADERRERNNIQRGAAVGTSVCGRCGWPTRTRPSSCRIAKHCAESLSGDKAANKNKQTNKQTAACNGATVNS